jgi:hypothetical protein
MSMRPSRIVVAALLAASLAAGCNKQSTPAASPTTGGTASGGQCEPAADAVVGTFKVDGSEQRVTYGELSGRIGAPLADLEKKKADLLKRGLEGYIIEKLVQAEAKKRGLPNEDALLKAEVEDKVAQPSDNDIQKLYDQAKAGGQLPPEVTIDQVRPEIVKHLTDQSKREKAQALFNDLKSKAEMQILLPEKRVQVAATGPAKGPESAPITIVEFSDFQCPFCSRANAAVDEVVKTYGDKVRVVFRRGLHVRRGPEQVLGVPRQALRQSAGPQGGRSQEGRGRPGPGHRPLQRVPGLRQEGGARQEGHGGR